MTARILFNYLINDITKIPVSLCKSSKIREQYIDVLERQTYSLLYNCDLLYLVKYIISQIENSFSIYYYVTY